MQNAGKLDKRIWDEFTDNWEDLVFESEKLLANLQQQDRGKEDSIPGQDSLAIPKETELVREVKTRVNQNFFRQVILSNYYHQCAICGLNIHEFLVAGHIIPWAVNHKERLNPQNGICLCTLHDKAFEEGFIGIKPDYQIVISKELDTLRRENYFPAYFGNYENMPMNLPDKFLPKPEFLAFRFQDKFKK